MPNIPKKTTQRLIDGIKKYQPIIKNLHSRDVNESDTVTLITDMLENIFGYDKYSEITREHAIRNTYVDLAIEINGNLQLLIEVKAIGINLNKNHITQAINYAANEGVDWTILTNGLLWQIYKLSFKKPVDYELVIEINIPEINTRNQSDIDDIFLLSKEALIKSGLDEYHIQKKATDKFSIAAIVLSDPGLSVIRRELRKLAPGVTIQIDDIKNTLTQDIIKRDIVDEEQLKSALKKVQRAAKKATKNKTSPPSTNTEEKKTTDIGEKPMKIKVDSQGKGPGYLTEYTKDHNRVNFPLKLKANGLQYVFVADQDGIAYAPDDDDIGDVFKLKKELDKCTPEEKNLYHEWIQYIR